MKNQKQFKNHAGSRGSAQAIPRELRDDQLVGYLLYREDTEEFLLSHNANADFSSYVWTLYPGIAYVWPTLQTAFNYSKFLDNPSKVVPFYDLGDKFLVVFGV